MMEYYAVFQKKKSSPTFVVLLGVAGMCSGQRHAFQVLISADIYPHASLPFDTV